MKVIGTRLFVVTVRALFTFPLCAQTAAPKPATQPDKEVKKDEQREWSAACAFAFACGQPDAMPFSVAPGFPSLFTAA